MLFVRGKQRSCNKHEEQGSFSFRGYWRWHSKHSTTLPCGHQPGWAVWEPRPRWVELLSWGSECEGDLCLLLPGSPGLSELLCALQMAPRSPWSELQKPRCRRMQVLRALCFSCAVASLGTHHRSGLSLCPGSTRFSPHIVSTWHFKKHLRLD